MTHAAARGSSASSNERDDGLGLLAGQVVLLQELGGLLLGAASDLSDHDDTLGVRVVQEQGQAVNEVGSVEGITTDTDAKGLAKTDLSGLVDSLVGKSTGAGDDTYIISIKGVLVTHGVDLHQATRIWRSTLRRMGEHTDLSDLMDVAGHDTDLAGIGGNDTGAVGSDQAGLILGLHGADNLLIKTVWEQ